MNIKLIGVSSLQKTNANQVLKQRNKRKIQTCSNRRIFFTILESAPKRSSFRTSNSSQHTNECMRMHAKTYRQM